jgi:hypothetical protein
MPNNSSKVTLGEDGPDYSTQHRDTYVPKQVTGKQGPTQSQRSENFVLGFHQGAKLPMSY